MKNLKLKLLNFPKVTELVSSRIRYNKHSPPDSSGQAPSYSLLIWFCECSFMGIVPSIKKKAGQRKGILIFGPLSEQTPLCALDPHSSPVWYLWHLAPAGVAEHLPISPVNCLSRQTRGFLFLPVSNLTAKLQGGTLFSLFGNRNPAELWARLH